MTLWRRFIAWVDADIVRTSPGLRGLASMMFFLPFLPLVFLDRFLPPEGRLRLAMFLLAGLSSAALLGIWLWRVLVNIRG